jgi:hypothetical protein
VARGSSATSSQTSRSSKSGRQVAEGCSRPSWGGQRSSHEAAVRDRTVRRRSSGSLRWTGRPSGPRGAGQGARDHGEPHRLWPGGGQAVDLPAVAGLRRPRRTVLGTEFAGEVEPVGDGVTAFFKVGDPGFGFSGTTLGAHAEYLVVPEDGLMAAIPEGRPSRRRRPAARLALRPLTDPGGKGPARPGRRGPPCRYNFLFSPRAPRGAI